MDFETAVRERIPILSILLNNFSMAIELPVMPVAHGEVPRTDISGNYADMARRSAATASGSPTRARSSPAIKRGIEQTAGGPARAAGVHHREGATVSNE